MHIHKIYHLYKWEYLIIRRARTERNAPQDTIINCAHAWWTGLIEETCAGFVLFSETFCHRIILPAINSSRNVCARVYCFSDIVLRVIQTQNNNTYTKMLYKQVEGKLSLNDDGNIWKYVWKIFLITFQAAIIGGKLKSPVLKLEFSFQKTNNSNFHNNNNWDCAFFL
jgi:hypothetical protein